MHRIFEKSIISSVSFVVTFAGMSALFSSGILLAILEKAHRIWRDY